MLPLNSLKSMNVMFATPCYISAVTMNYVASIFSMTCDAMHLGQHRPERPGRAGAARGRSGKASARSEKICATA